MASYDDQQNERTDVKSIHFIIHFNPFAPEPPVRIQVLSTLCDVISFNGQGQLSSLTCAE